MDRDRQIDGYTGRQAQRNQIWYNQMKMYKLA